MYSATTGLRTRRLELQEELSKIDVSDLPQGLYYILDEAGTRSSQFIKRSTPCKQNKANSLNYDNFRYHWFNQLALFLAFTLQKEG